MPVNPAAARWIVSGRVQGVGFRWFVRQAALRHGLAGDVRNLADGRVEVRVSGPQAPTAALLADVRRGPANSRVESVEVVEADPASRFEGFEVRF